MNNTSASKLLFSVLTALGFHTGNEMTVSIILACVGSRPSHERPCASAVVQFQGDQTVVYGKPRRLLTVQTAGMRPAVSHATNMTSVQRDRPSSGRPAAICCGCDPFGVGSNYEYWT